MEEIFALLIPLGCGCVLPIVIVWLSIRKEMNETNQRTQIILAAVEKNPDMDIEELIKKMSPKKKLLKEKLLTKLLWGSLTTILGLGFCGFGIYKRNTEDGDFIIVGLILLAVGLAFLINYFLGKKMLTKEMEAEENLAVVK